MLTSREALWAPVALLFGMCAAAGCGAGEAPGVVLREAALKLQPVAWNASKTATGKVAGVAEVYEDLAVFGDQGVQVFSSGVLFATDTTVKSWRAAAVVPAGDLAGEWAIGVSGDGKVLRLRNRSMVEDVSDRYGLKGTAIREVAPLGQGRVGFAYEQGLAVADGTSVTRYDGGFAGLVGGGGRVAAVEGDKLRVLATQDGSSQVYALPGLLGAAFDPAGKLVAATASQLYLEVGGELAPRYQSDAPIKGLVGTPSGVWLLQGDTLSLVSGEELRRGPAGALSGAAAAAGARLLPSASGDVWVLAGGALSRFSEDDGGGADKELWRKDVLPMFSRLCSVCHLPGGSAGIDLSTYASWASRRALMEQRVIVGKPLPMPPAGAGKLTAEETAALQGWLKSAP